MNRLFYPLVEPAIEKAVKDLRADPQKAGLGLVDLGLRFSSNPQRRQILQALRTSLQSPTCQYHSLLSRMAAGVNLKSLKAIGGNLTRKVLGDGAAKLEKQEAAWNVALPRAIAFDLRGEASLSACLPRLDTLMRQGEELGVYCYLLLSDSPDFTPKAAQALLDRHRDCVTALAAPPSFWQAAAASLPAALPHLACCLLLDGASAPEAASAAAALQQSSALYGGMMTMVAGQTTAMVLGAASALSPAFFVLLDPEGTPNPQSRKILGEVGQAQLSGAYPLVPFYLPAEITLPALFILSARQDGDFLSPAASATLGQRLRSRL